MFKTFRLTEETADKLKALKGKGKTWERFFMELTVKFKMDKGVLKRLEPDGKWREVVEEDTGEGYTWVTRQDEKLF